jgi:hypothetical protein
MKNEFKCCRCNRSLREKTSWEFCPYCGQKIKDEIQEGDLQRKNLLHACGAKADDEFRFLPLNSPAHFSEYLRTLYSCVSGLARKLSEDNRNRVLLDKVFDQTPAPMPKTFATSRAEGGAWEAWEEFDFQPGRAIKVHAIKFENGRIWDTVNGWRKK